MDDLLEKFGLGRDRGDRSGTVTFLPEPEPRHRHFVVISVDDHVVEPPNVFEGRLPRRFEDRTPRVLEGGDGSQVWDFDGKLLPNIGVNAVVGRPPEERTTNPVRFDEMRRGAWDIDGRIADMDIDGVYASLNFPSFLAGFSGQRLQRRDDPEFGLALVQAYNSWHIEDWAGRYPDRIIPCQLPWLIDPEVGASEIRKNAVLGFKAITFPEAPHKLGFPSLHSGHWDPLLRACEETETVVALHIGSSSTHPECAPDAPSDTIGVLFGFVAVTTAVDWLFSGVALRFPNLRIVLSEGGIGWVPALLDRLDHSFRVGQGVLHSWESELTPSEVLLRNFRFCALEDRTAYRVLDRIGSANVLVEVDYPHADGSWPDTQAHLKMELGSLTSSEQADVSWRNASELFRHPVPQDVLQTITID